MPEGNLVLSHAIIYLCEAEKSNSLYLAMGNAKKDALETKDDIVPSHLKNNSNLTDERPDLYKYPHNFGGYTKQQYMPDSLKDRVYYTPSENGREKEMARKKSRNV